ncbi:hypothetical protein BD324DRAFT_595218 [Kockovaella imperatae]|uniref:RNA-binding S4 domain-containing protein n=1 Tax=Kockovaella imperatae TaxID=4999 RepID=A0A1Y1U6X2_9TREE|nr:hypothetical protein BD324DRAFT_595218 [Kockovaella imperatae]ORX33789.1 hypothetical protein BD324DRAFT_595218 [Kockovaella imperatae]
MKPSLPASGIYRDLFNKERALPRMSWTGVNLYNLWQRTHSEGPLYIETHAGKSKTLYQQRFKARRYLAGYHLEGIVPIKQWERWYLPSLLPAIHGDREQKSRAERTLDKWIEGKESAGGRNRDVKDAEQKARQSTTPITSMMFSYIERRLDVVIFRACLASSVYQAKQFVVKGHVKVNGKVITNSASQLRPGDLFTVDYRVINFLMDPAKAAPAQTLNKDLEDAENEDASTSAPAESASSSQTAPVPSKPASRAPKSFFELPKFAQASLFVPAYLLPNYLTCSCVYVRHPTARPGYSEIPSPYDAGGEVMSLGWEWWKRKAPRMREGKLKRWLDPTRRKDRIAYPLPPTPQV